MHRVGRAARTLLLAVPVSSSLLTSACTSVRPVRAGRLPAAASVRVRFATARALPADSPAGDTVTLDGVRAVVGRVVAERGDTLALLVQSAEGSRVDGAAGRRVTVVRSPDDRVEARRFSGWRTAGLVVGVAAVAGAALLIALIAAMNDLNY